MPVTVRDLVEQAGLGLRFHPAAGGAGTPAVEAEIAWAHASDLLDPTPWLQAGQLLLTDGSHLRAGEFDEAAAAAYAGRLRRTGIVALGFAVGVVHDRVPSALVDACRDAGLPLLLVPAAMPFLRIVRHVADVAAADRSERLTWSIAAQRAIARAALQPDGLGATLRELEVRLGCWVALYDSLGRRVPVRTRDRPPAEVLPELGAAVKAQLERGRRAASHLTGAGHDITLQTIGQRERLRGVLAVGTSVPLDPAGNDLVASVIGIASIAIEQGRALDHARAALRRGVLELLLAGSTDAAARALRELGAWVPGERMRVAVVAGVGAWESVLEELELRVRGERFAFARLDDELVLVWDAEPAEAAKAPELAEGSAPADTLAFLRARGCRIGVSAPVPADGIGAGLDEARRALRRAAEPGELVEFGELRARGLVAWLDDSDAAIAAERLLAPLRDRPDADALLAGASAWFAHNCAWDPAARELGIHRHTLRSRIDALGAAVGLDLGGFAARAELWAALRLTDHDSG